MAVVEDELSDAVVVFVAADAIEVADWNGVVPVEESGAWVVEDGVFEGDPEADPEGESQIARTIFLQLYLREPSPRRRRGRAS